MNILDHLQVGPFRSDYHRELVDDEFRAALVRFCDREILSQLDGPIDEVNGTFVATYGSDPERDAPRLLREIFTFDVVFHAVEGTSELKADVIYNRTGKSFAPRPGRKADFYVWTPLRKRQSEEDKAAVKRLIDDVAHKRTFVAECPMSRGELQVLESPDYAVIGCARHCFYCHCCKNWRGRLVIKRLVITPRALRSRAD